MPAEPKPPKFPVSLLSTIRKTPQAILKIPGRLRNPRERWSVIIPALVVIAAIAGGAYYLSTRPTSPSSTQGTLQTTRVRQGDITLSASGSGTLQPAQQAGLSFGTDGIITKLDVKVGDQVEKGQVLAQLDNTSEQAAYQQAKRNLANLTSTTAVAQAQEDLATAQTTLTDATTRLKYVISPGVFDSQQQVELDQQALNQAKADGGDSPTAEQQKAIDDAQAKLTADQDKLNGDLIWYKEHYVPNTFTTQYRDPTTREVSKVVEAPTDVDIATAQANYKVAQTSVQEAQWYLDALNGQDIPADATGTNLTALEQAKSDLDTAQANLDATRIVAPFSGTIMSVDAQLGDTAGSSSSTNATSSSTGSSSVITLADLSTLYVQTYVDESDYQMFQVGNQANIVFDALPDQTFTGSVVQVNPTLDSSSGSSVVSGLVKMDPIDADLLMGMSASVDVIAGQAQGAVLIPVNALHQYAPGKYAVFVMRNGKLAVQDVQVGLEDLVNAEIKSGLQVGDVISTGLAETNQ